MNSEPVFKKVPTPTTVDEYSLTPGQLYKHRCGIYMLYTRVYGSPREYGVDPVPTPIATIQDNEIIMFVENVAAADGYIFLKIIYKDVVGYIDPGVCKFETVEYN